MAIQQEENVCCFEIPKKNKVMSYENMGQIAKYILIFIPKSRIGVLLLTLCYRQNRKMVFWFHIFYAQGGFNQLAR